MLPHAQSFIKVAFDFEERRVERVPFNAPHKINLVQ